MTTYSYFFEDIRAWVSAASVSVQYPEGFFLGAALGLLNIRPQNKDGELAILKRMEECSAGAVVPDQALSSKSVGLEWGISLRLRAERNAVQLHKYLAGVLPGIWLKHIFARGRSMELLIANLHPLERRLLCEAYSLRYGRELRSVVERLFGGKRVVRLQQLLEFSSGKDEVKALNLPKPKAISDSAQLVRHTPDATTVHEALFRRNQHWVGALFLGLDAEARAELAAKYEERYGSLTRAIERRYRGWEREFTFDLVRDGRVSWAKLLYFCVKGIGTDEAGLHEILGQMNLQEINTARSEFRVVWRAHAPWYERLFPNLLGDLERRIWVETGGDSYFELQEYLSDPSPESDLMHNRLERLYHHERSGVLLKKLDFFSHEGAIMDADVSRLRQFYLNHLCVANDNECVRIRFDALVRYCELDCEVFRALKHFVGNLVSALTATVCVAGATFALTSQRVALPTVMILVALLSVISRLLLKRLLKGRGYHRGEIWTDIFFGVLDGATLFTAYLFRQAIIRFGTKLAATLGVKSGFTRISQAMQASRIRRWGVSMSDLGRGRAP